MHPCPDENLALRILSGLSSIELKRVIPVLQPGKLGLLPLLLLNPAFKRLTTDIYRETLPIDLDHGSGSPG